MRKTFDERLSVHNITTSQFEIMGYLYQTGGLEQLQLQHCTGITSATLTGLLDKLEDRDYITRKPSAHDGRAKVVVLTSDGDELCTQLIDLMHHFENDMLKGFSEVERILFTDWLQRAAKNLGDADYKEC
jgi:DNA-binding MarR family transcriptional regulator